VVWGWNHENGGLGHGAEMVFTVQSGLGLESIENGGSDGVSIGNGGSERAGIERYDWEKGKEIRESEKRERGKVGGIRKNEFFFRRGTWRFTFGLEL